MSSLDSFNLLKKEKNFVMFNNTTAISYKATTESSRLTQCSVVGKIKFANLQEPSMRS